MPLRTYAAPLLVGSLAAGSLALGTGLSTVAGASSKAPTCKSLTKAVVAADGFPAAKTPKISAYNYVKTSANPANALGTTIDFGSKALVVSCVSPADLKKLSITAQGVTKPPMSAEAYMAYLVGQSAGAMKGTPVGGVSDSLDFGNGKEDGLGSTSTASSVRLDAWVAGNFIILAQTAPATSTPSTALLNFISTTEKVL